jgi:hypothetical protein
VPVLGGAWAPIGGLPTRATTDAPKAARCEPADDTADWRAPPEGGRT